MKRIPESKIRRVVREAMENFFSRGPMNERYEIISGAGSSIGAQRRNSVRMGLTFANPSQMESLITEGVYELPEDRRGGIIVFSTDVNAIKKSERLLVNWIWQKFRTIYNRFRSTSMIDRVLGGRGLGGWTIGHYFTGRYQAKNGQFFGEKSMTIEILDIADDTLIEIAEAVCAEFDQESVLLKLNNGRIMFVDPNDRNGLTKGRDYMVIDDDGEERKMTYKGEDGDYLYFYAFGDSFETGIHRNELEKRVRNVGERR